MCLHYVCAMKSIKQYNLGGCSIVIIDGSGIWNTPLRWPQLAWYTSKFNKDWFGYWCNIKVITSTIWETAVLVLLMGRIYDVRRWDDFRWHDINTKFHNDRFRNSSNNKDNTWTIGEAVVSVLLMEGIYDVHRWDGFRWMIYLSSFMNIGSGFQAIFRFCLRNWRCC
jgi:hypothetical protein